MKIEINEINSSRLQKLMELKKFTDINDFCNNILNEYFSHIDEVALDSSSISQTINESQHSHKNLIKFYNSCYEQKFNIENTEEVNLELLDTIFDKINKHIKDKKETDLKIKKAIAWYIYHHSNINKNGTRFNHKFNTLLKEDWLLKNALEFTVNQDLNYIVDSALSGMSMEEYDKAHRKGDIATIEHSNIPERVQDILIELQELTNSGIVDKKTRKHPKLSKLFEAENPDGKYVSSAEKFIKKIKEAIQ